MGQIRRNGRTDCWILAAVSFWLNRGKVEERADQALARAKEGIDRYDRITSAFADYRAAIAADIAIVKTLAETNTAALASAENRLAAAIEQMNARFGELNQRIDRLLDGERRNASFPIRSQIRPRMKGLLLAHRSQCVKRPKLGKPLRQTCKMSGGRRVWRAEAP